MASTIDAFWSWFVSHRDDLAQDNISNEVISALEGKLFAISRLDWEIGPYKQSGRFFALSTRGNTDSLTAADDIIAKAPNICGWQFYSGKPPRDWSLVFDIECRGRLVEIDAKRWEFVLYRFKDGVCDLLLKPDVQALLPFDCLELAGVIIADGELGEKRRMRSLNKIEVVRQWSAKEQTLARSLEVGLLSQHVLP